ncbi:YfiR family protein [Pedobacter sp. P351]|uniref:YfiR family protein n=1 Tax=Pedobacter superstes TaxID=3133441 RepID=UPI0030B71CD0
MSLKGEVLIKSLKISYLWIKFSLVCMFVLGATFISAQRSPASEDQLKAAFIYNFTRFVDWPPDYFSTSSSPFIIGILGDESFKSYIDEIVKGEKLGDRAIVVQRYRTVKEIKHCHILFISAYEATRIKGAIPALNRRGILTVSDGAEFAKWGGIVRFFKDDNKLRLQINIDEAKSSQLIISSKLLSLSSIYSKN